MATSGRYWGWKLAGASLLAMGGAISSSGNYVFAQITPDGTLGAESSVVTPTAPDSTVDVIQGGATRGANLFHSFEQFSVLTGRVAFFNNASAIQNILSRVTGGSVSNIDGLLQANASANLFLLNPNGIIFGPNASLDIGGSFVGSTASSLNFADGTQFSATAPQTTPLLTISVPIGLQYGGTAGSILNQSQATDSSGQFVGLQVQPGETLALLGGNVRLDGGILLAPGSRVELGGVTGAGTVELNVDGNNLSFSYPASVQRADVSLSNGAFVDVTAGSGGSIAVNAQNVDIFSGVLLAGVLGQGSVDSKAGDIEINATGTVSISEGGIFNDVFSSATGTGGGININTGSLMVDNGSELSASTDGQGNSGSVTIHASDTVSFSESRIFSAVLEEAVGNGGNISIDTRALNVRNGSRLVADTVGQGKAGNVTIRASDTVSFSGVGADGRSSGARSFVDETAVGNGGSVSIDTRALSVTDGAQLNAATLGQGNAGSVVINASDTISFSGSNANFNTSGGAFSSVQPRAVGTGGDVIINTRVLSVTDGAQLSASTSGRGDAGSVEIRASDTISFSGITSNGFGASGVLSSVEDGALGNGGNVNIDTRSLSVTDGAQVSAITRGRGSAGNIEIRASDTVSFSGVNVNGIPTGAFSTVEVGAIGNGGNVRIDTRSLGVTDGAGLVASTRGQGNAGNVTIRASDTVSFSGVGPNGDPSGAGSSVDDAGAIGDGGNVSIDTHRFSVTNGAQIAVFTMGQGNAGSVTIRASDTVSFSGVSANGDPSSIDSAVQTGAVGNGGDINIQTGSLSLDGAGLLASTDGQGNAGSVRIQALDTVSFSGFPSGIASTVENAGVGNGGDIQVQANSLSLTDGSGLLSRSRGQGDAGDIFIDLRDALQASSSQISASSDRAGGGRINITARDIRLRHSSPIITSVFNGMGGGGDITLNTDLLVALENSDITANAFEGRGGNIQINTQGIFGTEFREQLTLESDITASSQFGVSGVVEINNPDVDPSQGLVELPAELVDASGLIAQDCAAVGENEFVITGRGGLPPSPSEPLSTQPVWQDLRPPARQVANRSDAAPSTNSTRVSAPTEIVEASGWMVNNKGEVVLTTQAPTTSLNIPWLPDSGCNVPEPES